MPGTDVERRPLNLPVPLDPGRKRQSEALPVAAFRSARRNHHLTVPLAVPPLLWLAGEALHAYGPLAAAGATAAGATATVSTWFFAPHKWTDKEGGPRWPEVWYARATAAGCAAYLSAGAFAGVASGTSGEVLGGALLAGSGAWGYFWWKHKRPRGRRRRQREMAYWQNAWEIAAPSCGLYGAHAVDVETEPARVRLRLQLVGGKQTYAYVRSCIPSIESAFDGVTDIGMVDVRRVPGRPSQADVILRLENPLKDIVQWDQSLAPRSVHDEGILAMADNGKWDKVPLRVSRFVNGKTRSGKGNDLLLLLAQLSGCPDSREVVIDLKQRAARTLLRSGAVEHVITSRDEARAYLAMLCAEIPARARECDTGEEQLLATEMTPAIHTLIDETNPLTSVTAGDSECARLLETVASAGAALEVYADVYTQYGALGESVRTEQTRSNLPLRVCYATESRDHGAFALGDGYQWDGPDTSQLEEKGELYRKLGPKARPERRRAPHMPFKLFLEIAGAHLAASGPKRPLHLYCGNEPSIVPGMTWQEWWDRRHLRIDPVFRKDSPQYAAAVEQFGEPAETAPAARPSRPAGIPAAGDGPPGAEVAAMIAAETSAPDLPPAPGAAAAAAGSREARLAAFCDALAAASGGISPAALMEASGMPRSTVNDYLRRLLDRGALARPREGVYVPVPGRSVHAELGAVRAGDDALLGEGPGRLKLAYSAS